jgi:hypothetical protein
MRPIARWAALAAVLTTLPIVAHAQTTTHPAFAQPFVFTERDGTGTLTITPLASQTSDGNFRRIRTELVQSGRRYTGAGVYSERDAQAGILESPLQLTFTLGDTSGRVFFFSGTLSRSGSSGYAGQGTYFLVTTPENTISWRIQSQDTGGSGGEPILSSRPTLQGGWVQNAFAEAIGGTYFATFNTNQGVAARATWSGTLPASGRYRVEAFIPRQRQGFTPRTERATYRIGGSELQSDAVQRISQNLATSSWVDLGTYNFGANYQVVLTDETGEPAFTRSVIANAIRLTPVTGTGTGTGSGF